MMQDLVEGLRLAIGVTSDYCSLSFLPLAPLLSSGGLRPALHPGHRGLFAGLSCGLHVPQHGAWLLRSLRPCWSPAGAH